MTIPVLLEQALLEAVLAMNLIFVSSAGTSAISSVSFVDQITLLVSYTFALAGIGVSVIVAQLTGQGDESGVRLAIRQALILGGIFAFSACFLGLFFNQPLIAWLMKGSEESVIQNASLYLQLSAVSFPFLMAFQVLVYVLRGRGQTKATMFITLFQTVISTVLSFVLITTMKMGIVGAGLALIISRAVGAACCFAFLIKLGLLPKFRLPDLRLHPAVQKNIFKIGFFPGLELAVMGIVKVAIMSMVAQASGTAQLAAVWPAQIAIDILALFPLALCYVYPTAIGFAKSSLQKKELISYANRLVVFAIAASAVSHILFGLLAVPYANLFGLPAETTQTIVKITRIAIIIQCVPWVFSYIIPPMMRGAGDSLFAPICSASTVVLVRYPVAYYLCVVRGMGAYGLYIAMFVDFTVKGTLTLLYFLWGKWAEKKKIEIRQSKEPTDCQPNQTS